MWWPPLLYIWTIFCIFNVVYDLRFAKLNSETLESIFIDAKLSITFVWLNIVYRSGDPCKLNGHEISLHIFCRYFQMNIDFWHRRRMHNMFLLNSIECQKQMSMNLCTSWMRSWCGTIDVVTTSLANINQHLFVKNIL